MSALRLFLVGLLAVCGLAGWWWLGQTRPGPAGSADQFEGLDPVKQKEIWDLEHVTFVLETYVGKPFARALADRSPERLAGFFRPGFVAHVPERAPVERISQAGIEQAVITADAGAAAGRETAEFCDYLVASLSEIAEVESAKWRVLQISRSDSPGSPGSSDLWSLEVLVTAAGRDERSNPIAWESRSRVTCRFTDTSEIHAGTLFERWDVLNVVHRTSEQPLMEEVTRQVGLDRLPIQDNWTTPLGYVRQYIFQAAVEDFDLDGRLDIAVATIDGQCLLLRAGEDGTFRDVADEVGIRQQEQNPQRSYLATWLDFDNDGYPDLLLGSTLYRNVGGRSFEPVPDNGGLEIGFNPMGAVVADYDCDGLLDVYLLYQRTRDRVRTHTPAWVGDDQSGAPNQLWRNVGGDRFEDVTEAAGASGGARQTFAATWLHVNDDRYPDLYVANDFGMNTLLVSRGDGTFADETHSAGVGDFATSMGVASGDIDNDGQPEIYVANMFSKMGRRIIAHVAEHDYPPGVYEQLLGSCAGNRLYQTRPGQGRYQELSVPLGVNEVGWAYAPAFADFDGDGQLDIYATAGFISFDRQKPDG